MEVGNLAALFVAAIIVERLTEWTKRVGGDKFVGKVFGIDTFLLVALFWGELIAIGFSVNFFEGSTFRSGSVLLETILTGWVMSGGSNFLFDFIQKIKAPQA